MQCEDLKYIIFYLSDKKITKNILFVWVNALPSKGSVCYNWSVNTYNETHAGILSVSHLYSQTTFVSISQQISQHKPEIVLSIFILVKLNIPGFPH